MNTDWIETKKQLPENQVVVCAEKDSEIERLKGLIEKAYSSAYNKGYMDCRDRVENFSNPFDQFAKDNNL